MTWPIGRHSQLWEAKHNTALCLTRRLTCADMSGLRTIGTQEIVRVENCITKWEQRAWEGTMAGYTSYSKA